MATNPGTGGLEAWWELNEESGSRADSHGSNTLTDGNTVLFGTGKQGNAADFELSNSESLSIVDNAALSVADEDFTIGCWVKAETLGAGMTILAKWDSGNNDREYLLFYDFNLERFRYFVSNNGTTVADLAADELGAPSIATWYFIVAWHDAAGNTLNIQVNNGTVDSSAYTLGCNDNVSDFVIGNDDGGSNYFDGLVDETFLYKKLLTSLERTYLYNSGNGRAYSELLDAFVPKVMVF